MALEYVENGDSGYHARTKINNGFDLIEAVEDSANDALTLANNALIAANDALTASSNSVKKSGDTMTGTLSVPKVLATAAQGSEVNALTRKDYVDSGDKKVLVANMSWDIQTSDFLTGSANTPNGSGRTEYCSWISWGHSGGQKLRHTIWCPAESDKLTELWFGNQVTTTPGGTATNWRIYHQGFKPTAADVGALPTTGGTVSGEVTVSSTVKANSFHVKDSNTAAYLSLVRQGDQVITFDMYPDGSGAYQVLKFDGLNRTTNFVQAVGGVTPTKPEHLTRKDYVDGELTKKVNASDNSYWNSNGGASDLGAPSMSRPGYWSFNPGAAESPNAAAYGHGFSVGNGSDQANGVWAQQIAFCHDGKIYYRRRVNDVADNQAWSRFYTTDDKPTPADIGAPSKMVEGTNFTGKSMTVVLLGKNGRNYPITAPLVAGTYWVSERGGENADRDYDFGFTISGTSPSFSFSGVGGASIVKIYTM